MGWPVLLRYCAWSFKRIPNWLTVTGLVAGSRSIALSGWAEKASLLGAALGLVCCCRSCSCEPGRRRLETGGALGAFTGPVLLIDLLVWHRFSWLE